MMTPFPPKTPMQMRREAEHGPPRPTPPLTPQQKREIEAKHPQLGGGSRTSRPAASKCADSCSSPRTFANIRDGLTRASRRQLRQLWPR